MLLKMLLIIDLYLSIALQKGNRVIPSKELITLHLHLQMY